MIDFLDKNLNAKNVAVFVKFENGFNNVYIADTFVGKDGLSHVSYLLIKPSFKTYKTKDGKEASSYKKLLRIAGNHKEVE